ncbi:MAG: hypothetical protein DA328_04410 [Nitrososphaeraceae archaeon]|nr:hypothetical protein [Nitrososphaeraceae archaeon]
MSIRDAVNIVVVGSKGSGKTTFALEWAEKMDRPCFLITYTDDRKTMYFKDLDIDHLVNLFPGDGKGLSTFGSYRSHKYRINIHDLSNAEVFNAIYTYIRDSTIIFDDASSFFNPQRSSEFMRIVTNTRHHSNDIIYLYHQLDEIANSIINHIKYLVLFKSGIRPHQKLKSFDCYDEIEICFNEVLNENEIGYFRMIDIIS